MKKYVVMALVCCTILSYAMEQSPFERVNQEQERHELAKECANRVSDRIDKEILGINENGWFRIFVAAYYTRNRSLSLTTQQEEEEELTKIASYIPATVDHELVMNKLMEGSNLFSCLINRVVDHEVNCLHKINGRSIDDCLKVRTTQSSSLVGKFIKAKALKEYQWQKDGCTHHLPTISFDQDKEIHFVPLFGHKNSVYLDKDKLLMSSDSKYLRAIDDSDNVVVWDMESGNRADIETTAMVWTRLDEGNHHCTRQRVIDKNGKYLATPGMALAFGSWGIHKIIQNEVAKKYSFPVIMLFVRPTVESHLCQNAFVNSRGDEEALNALLKSQMLSNITGFPAVNLKSLIKQELERLRKQQARL